MSDGAKMTGERSYSDLSDSATTFDPEEQFDRDIDERMKGMSACPVCRNPTFCYPDGRKSCLRCEWEEEKGMSKEEAVANALRAAALENDSPTSWDYLSRAAIAAANKWDAEQGNFA